MGSENAFCQTSRFKQCKGQEYHVPHTAPHRSNNIVTDREIMNRHSINPYTDKNQKSLKSQCQLGFEIILSDLTLFPVGKRRERNRSQRSHQINFDHSSVDNYENNQ